MNDNKIPLSGKLIFKIALTIFNVLLASSIIFALVLILMARMQMLIIGGRPGILGILISLFITSIIIGTILGIIFSYRTIKPFKELSNASQQIAKGNFKVKIDEIPVDEDDSEMNELIKNFNIMAAKLAEIETLRNDFISNVSHEFKTPLATIQGYVTLLGDEKLTNEERKKYVDIIFDATTKLTNLTSNILKISKLENQEVEIVKLEYNLSEQLREVIILLQASWEKKNIVFDINLDDCIISSDEELLMQVWINVLTNAIKFSYDFGKIEVNLKCHSNYVIIKFKDYGCGMSEETLLHMFDKFYQGDKSHSKEGNGLGLALSKQIITLCNGKITANSKLDEGTIVTQRSA